jgi:arylsulfatase A-like enzyme
MSHPRFVPVVVLLLALPAGLALRARLVAHQLERDRARWNVIVVTVDTTRADRLGAYGFRDANTPAIDRLARDGVLFEQAESPAPLTLPAHSSLFTGRFPFQHGVRDNNVPLNDTEITLAQVLQAHGIRTGAVTAAYVLDSRFGLARGFDMYDGSFHPRRGDGPHLEGIRRAADEVVNRAMEWIDTVSSTQFFAWLHFYDAHAPYAAPLRDVDEKIGYQGAIAFIDSQIGRLMAFLDARRLATRTVIVLVGDHGESLGEHGERAHGFFIYEAVTRVPLIIRTPDSELRGRRVSHVVRSVDVMPTVLDLLNVRAPSSIAGVSLLPRMKGLVYDSEELETYSETMYPQYHFGWSALRAVRAGRFKFIAAPRPELYDLDEDPGERRNLYALRPSLAAALAGRLRTWEQTGGGSAARDPQLDRDARERLDALGYVGRRLDWHDSPTSLLEDPKDKIALYQLVTGDRARHTAARVGED